MTRDCGVDYGALVFSVLTVGLFGGVSEVNNLSLSLCGNGNGTLANCWLTSCLIVGLIVGPSTKVAAFGLANCGTNFRFLTFGSL